jgi:hypothetical protein
MANTIITKNSATATAVPTAGQLVQGELAVNVTDKRLFTENSGGTVVELGTNPSQVNFADNSKAIFGAGSDLQIYHTGSHSWVQDAGTGNLYIAGEQLWLTNSDNTKQFLKGDSTGRVDLYYNTSVKLATTSTGIDVTGTVVADGLTVGNTSAAASQITITSSATGVSSIYFADADPDVGRINYDHSTNALSFVTANTTKVTIDSAGNVGIGTTSPPSYGSTFTVVQASNSGSGVVQAQSTTNSVITEIESEGTRGAVGTRTNHDLAFKTNQTERMRLTSTGLGIGTTSISGKLSINGEVYAAAGSASGVAYGFYPKGTYGNTGMFSPAPNTVAFATTGGERVRIDSSGNLLVGTTSQGTTEKLHVSSATTEVARFTNSVNTSGYSGIRVVVGASDTSTWHFRGETRGVSNWYLYGNGTTSYSSDSRLKKNIETTRDGYLNDLMQLRVVKYNWINSQDTTPKELGLIAQEVEQVFPNLVQEHDIEGVDGQRKHIKHSVMEFILIKAIQEQQAIIESLKARLDAANL